MRDEDERLERAIGFERNGDLQRALEAYKAVAAVARDAAVVAEALRRQSTVYRMQCAWDAALAAARASAQTAIRAQLPELFAEALNAEAAVYVSRGDFVAAKPLLEQILALAAEDRIRGIAHQNLGHIAAHEKDFGGARDHFRESREYFRRARYRRGEAIALANQSAIAILARDYESALVAAKAAITVARELNDYELVAAASLNQAEALVGFERYAEAEELASQAMGFFGIEGNTYRQIGCLRLLGDINRARRNFENAVRCYEQALKLAEGIDAQVERVQIEDRMAELERTTAA